MHQALREQSSVFCPVYNSKLLLELCLLEVIKQDFLFFLYSESGRSSGVLPRKFGALHSDAKGHRNWNTSGSKLGKGQVSSDRIMQYLLY